MSSRGAHRLLEAATAFYEDERNIRAASQAAVIAYVKADAKSDDDTSAAVLDLLRRIIADGGVVTAPYHGGLDFVCVAVRNLLAYTAENSTRPNGARHRQANELLRKARETVWPLLTGGELAAELGEARADNDHDTVAAIEAEFAERQDEREA